jgi:hypothetical protein
LDVGPRVVAAIIAQACHHCWVGRWLPAPLWSSRIEAVCKMRIIVEIVRVNRGEGPLLAGPRPGH